MLFSNFFFVKSVIVDNLSAIVSVLDYLSVSSGVCFRMVAIKTCGKMQNFTRQNMCKYYSAAEKHYKLGNMTLFFSLFVFWNAVATVATAATVVERAKFTRHRQRNTTRLGILSNFKVTQIQLGSLPWIRWYIYTFIQYIYYVFQTNTQIKIKILPEQIAFKATVGFHGPCARNEKFILFFMRPRFHYILCLLYYIVGTGTYI